MSVHSNRSGQTDAFRMTPLSMWGTLILRSVSSTIAPWQRLSCPWDWLPAQYLGLGYHFHKTDLSACHSRFQWLIFLVKSRCPVCSEGAWALGTGKLQFEAECLKDGESCYSIRRKFALDWDPPSWMSCPNLSDRKQRCKHCRRQDSIEWMAWSLQRRRLGRSEERKPHRRCSCRYCTLHGWQAIDLLEGWHVPKHPWFQQRLSWHSHVACKELSLSELPTISDPKSVKVSLKKALALSAHFVGCSQGPMRSFEEAWRGNRHGRDPLGIGSYCATLGVFLLQL